MKSAGRAVITEWAEKKGGRKENMNIIYYSEEKRGADILQDREPMLAVISYDGSNAVVGLIDEGVEHHILLRKALGMTDLDQYFRIVFDEEGADWTFVCPAGYKAIQDKEKRIQTFYRDGITVIRRFLETVGFDVPVDIPRRYRRHFNYMGDLDF